MHEMKKQAFVACLMAVCTAVCGAFADDVFYVPLTQEETFNLDEGTSVEFDVRVHFIGGAVVVIVGGLREGVGPDGKAILPGDDVFSQTDLPVEL